MPTEITQLLVAWEGGDREAFEGLIPLVYPELRRLAHRYMSRGRAARALETTALLHEAYSAWPEPGRHGGRAARISLQSRRISASAIASFLIRNAG